MTVNKVILIGNLGADPEVRHMPDGTAVARLSLATSDVFKDRQGERKEHTEWHRVELFGRQAEIAGEYLKKGSKIYVEGQIRTRKWQDKSGNDRWTTEIRGLAMKFLSPKGSDSAASVPKQPKPSADNAFDDSGLGDIEDDIPF